MKTEPNEQAFRWISGLTKREYFAGLAMQGLLANPNGAMMESNRTTVAPHSLATVALQHADALITELNK